LSGQDKMPLMQEFNTESAPQDGSAKKRQNDFQKKMTQMGAAKPIKFSLDENDDGLNDEITQDAVKEATEPLNKKIS
jgi:hypothetical protein